MYFYLQKLRVGPATRLAKSVNMQQRTGHVLNFRGKYDDLTPVFALQIKDPKAKFLKLYVRVVNSIHLMQDW
jgi:hypothetical protein